LKNCNFPAEKLQSELLIILSEKTPFIRSIKFKNQAKHDKLFLLVWRQVDGSTCK